MGPTLREKGLLFVGLDVIGDYLTEINVTSPTCIREIDNAYNTDIGGKLMDAIDRDFERDTIRSSIGTAADRGISDSPAWSAWRGSARRGGRGCRVRR